MNLEHTEHDGREAILIRATDRDEIRALREVFRTLAEASGRRVSINGLPFVTNVDDCRLQATSRDRDDGVVARDRPASFRWTLQPESWKEVERRLGAVVAGESGADGQLNPSDGPAVIFDASG